MQGNPRYPPGCVSSQYQRLDMLTFRLLYYYSSCSMALRSKYITRWIAKCGVTHFLAIPLVTPTSRTQVSDSFTCLWNDLAAIGVPTSAIRPLGLLHLTLDVPLSLNTSERMAKAKKILHQISIKTSEDDINNSMASPSVSISGLFCMPGKEAEAFSLSTKVYDPTHRVRKWRLRLAHAYQAAYLCPELRQPKPRDASVRLVHIPHSTEIIPSIWEPEKLRNRPLPPFDARGLLERYKDHLWVENAPLERVSICKIGLHRLGAKELQEDFSVPL